MEWSALFEQLKQQHFDGYIIQELYSDSYQGQEEVLDGFRQLKNAMNRSKMF